MRSYSETNVFIPEHLALFAEVQTLVASFPDTDIEGRLLRCHEIARAVAIAFNLTVIDGVYGCVEHSWCMIPKPLSPKPLLIGERPLGTHYRVIIDPYAVGRLPQVQMVSVGSTLPHDRWYSERKPRTDIREDVLRLLCEIQFFPVERVVVERWVGDVPKIT
jgi:hypothetical protein